MKDGDFMRKTSKIFVIILITFLIVCMFNEVFALDPNTYLPSDPTNTDAQKVTEKVSVILGAIRNISAIVAVISLMVIGLKYMFGSIEEKANYKATALPYVVGIILVVAGTTIVSFIYNAVH